MSKWVCKGVVVGESGVGKSNILLRFAKDLFAIDYRTTLACSFFSRQIETTNGPLEVEIWDTAGQERFRKITCSYFRDVDFVIVVYDITDRRSFELVPLWLKTVITKTPECVQIIILGNKLDMNKERKISTEEGAALATEYDIPFVETSAKENMNIDTAFKALLEKTLEIPICTVNPTMKNEQEEILLREIVKTAKSRTSLSRILSNKLRRSLGHLPQ